MEKRQHHDKILVKQQRPFAASYDPFGHRTISNNKTPLQRGYCGHLHYDHFGLIDMGGRVYDPILGRFLSPDPYVQAPENSQNFNRYSYCLNNPLKYTDPTGEFWWGWLPYAIGAVVGGFQGYHIGESSGLSGLGIFATTFFGAGIGVASAGLSNYAASSGCIMSNTLGIMAGSFSNSLGMTMLGGFCGQNIPMSISFGAGALTFGTNGVELGYLGKKGNSGLDNLGYGLGSMTNLSDLLLGEKSLVDLVTNHEGVEGHSALVGSQVTYEMGHDHPDKLISFGPNNGNGEKTIWCPGNPNWDTYTNAFQQDMVWRQSIQVNAKMLNKYSSYLSEHTPHYSWLISSCVTHTSRALNLSGVYNIGIHPYLLHLEMYLRANGFRPMFSSYYLNSHVFKL